MTLYKTTRSSVIRMAILGVSVMAVSACADFGPHPLATGYKYQQEEYKSAAGPEPVIEKYTRRDRPEAPVQQAVPVQAMDGYWYSAANELVARMVRNLGQPAEPVYIDDPKSPEESQFAMALHQALRNHNIPMADRNAGAPFGMEYRISVIDVGTADRRMISIQLISAGEVVHEESGIYTVATVVTPVHHDIGDQPPMHGDYEMDTSNGAPVSIAP